MLDQQAQDSKFSRDFGKKVNKNKNGQIQDILICKYN